MSEIEIKDGRPEITYLGVRHVDMTRDQLMDFIESLDYFISNKMWKLAAPLAVGVDFGTKPAAMVRGEIEFDIDFEALPDISPT